MVSLLWNGIASQIWVEALKNCLDKFKRRFHRTRSNCQWMPRNIKSFPNLKKKIVTLKVKWRLDFRGGQIFHPTYSQWALKFHLPSSDLFPILWMNIFDQIQGFQGPTRQNILSKSLGRVSPLFNNNVFVKIYCKS